MATTKPQTVDEYIAGFSRETQVILEEIRTTIQKAAPEAEEKIAYKMPTYHLNGNLLSFGAWKKHIGIYPIPAELSEELVPYKAAKSSVHFPLKKPLPLDLITKIIKSRIKELSERTTKTGKVN